jgi:hypothetical protein
VLKAVVPNPLAKMKGVPESIDRDVAVTVIGRERLKVVFKLGQKMGGFSQVEGTGHILSHI